MMEYIKEILSSHSKESSKRFVSIWSMGLLTITCVTVWFKGSPDAQLILIGTLITFISTLLGLATRESLRKKSIEKGDDTEVN